MDDSRDYRQFLKDLPLDDFRRFVTAFGGEHKGPEEIFAWVNSPERERLVCNKIRQVFGVELLTAAERQETIGRAAADATQRQATAAEKANVTAEKALRVAEHSMFWAKVTAVVAVLAFIVSLVGLFT